MFEYVRVINGKNVSAYVHFTEQKIDCMKSIILFCLAVYFDIIIRLIFIKEFVSIIRFYILQRSLRINIQNWPQNKFKLQLQERYNLFLTSDGPREKANTRWHNELIIVLYNLLWIFTISPSLEVDANIGWSILTHESCHLKKKNWCQLRTIHTNISSLGLNKVKNINFQIKKNIIKIEHYLRYCSPKIFEKIKKWN